MPAHLPPVPVLIHLGLALFALVVGPLALTARKGTAHHRGLGYAWVVAMLGAAVSSLFLRDFVRPNIGGYTLIHLLALATFIGVGRGLWEVMHRRIAAHRKTMWGTYLGGCVVAGLFAMTPHRFLGGLLAQAVSGIA